MRAEKAVKKTAALAAMLKFTRPGAVKYASGIIIYGCQTFCFGLFSAFLMQVFTRNILSSETADLAKDALIMIGILAVYFVILGLGVYNYVLSELKTARRLKKALFRSFVHSSVEEQSRTGQGIAALNIEADTAVDSVFSRLALLIASVSSFMLSGVTIFIIDWRLGLVSLGVGLMALAVQSGFAGPMRKIASGKLKANAAATNTLSGMIDAGSMIRAYSLQQNAQDGFDAENKKILFLQYKQATISVWQKVCTNLQSWLSLAGVFGVGAYLVMKGSLDFSVLIMVPGLCMSMGYGLSTLGQAWTGMQMPLEAAERLCNMLRGSEQRAAAESRAEPVWNGDTTLCADSLSFSYLHAEAPTLYDISLRINPGEMVAFVGESGCGKSTLLRLLAGLYERGPQPVTLGNLVLGEMNPAKWREHFAVVDQSCKLFNLTIGENIALGKKGATQEEIAKAALEAGAAEFIEQLPQGYDTPCGDRGTALSGGQKQRIAIARALVRKSAVLMLDEAASALDAISEQFFMSAIENLRGSYTILMVTHNLEQAAKADKIFVLREGRICESGGHDALLKKGGEYARLWADKEVQNAGNGCL